MNTPKQNPWWEPETDSYQQKAKNSRIVTWFIIAMCGVIIVVAGLVAIHEVKNRQGPSVEQQLNDTLFQDHSKIPEDSL